MEMLKKDNRGAALVLVLLVAALVSMLVTLVLVATVSNAKSKSTEQIGNNNFNVADSAIEELTMGLEEIADSALRDAYTHMLLIYSKTVQKQRLQILQELFSNSIVGKIAAGDGTSKVDIDKLRAMIVDASNGSVLTGNNADEVPTYLVDTDYSVVIKDVKITYTDDKGYETIITTDIRFSIPASLVDVSKISDSIDFKGFSIITDGYLKMEAAGSSAGIDGSVYAKNGINAKSTTLSMTGDYVISRGSLIAENGASVSMTNESSQLWVKNVETLASGGYAATSPSTWITLKGINFVADDLSLNADYADVVVTGNYYGYHTTNSTSIQAGDASGSSAIVINAANANLDMSSANTVMIAGKTYLTIPNYYYDTTLSEEQLASITVNAVNYQTFLQGESLSFKGVQSAYMVPGDCIMGLNHNPLTASEYEQLQAAEAAGSSTMRVYIGQNVKNGGIDLNDYVDSSTPYKARYVQYYGKNGAATTMVYLYLNFTSPNKAADYFMEYYNRYSLRVENMADYLKIGDIVTGANVIHTGNLILNKNNVLEVVARNRDYSDSSVTKQEMSYTRKFNGLITYLDPSYYTNDTTKNACDLLIHFETPTADCSGLAYQTADYVEGCDQQKYYDVDDGLHIYTGDNADKHPFVLISPYNVVITKSSDKVRVETKDNDQNSKGVYTVDAAAFEGLIICAGELSLTDATFNGMIIARNGVTLSGSATLTNHAFAFQYYHYYSYEVAEDGTLISEPETEYMNNVEDLIRHDQKIYRWFKTFIPSGVEDSNGAGENGVDITFENWTKNY